MWRKRLVPLLAGCAGVLALVLDIRAPVYADHGAPEAVITGAGAHFAWVIFDRLRFDLEKVAGHPIKLYGRNSTLGMGCNAGIKTALQNRPHHQTFGFVCCPLDEDEVKRKKLRVYPIAVEPILIVVNQDNPVHDLSAEQVRAMMRGDIVNWKEVGGLDEPVVVVTRLHCKKRPGHWKTILPEAGEFRSQRLNVSSAGDMVQRVGDFRGALGHIGSTWDFGPGSHVRAITVGGVAPTADNLRSGRYPFFRQLAAVTNEHPSREVLAIIREVQQGPAFRRVAARYQLLPAAEPGKPAP
ncbi:MAG TPA: hypothetical protein ENJ01_08195 [Gammaproteobacteria bacterium]|nr:hypothetical protein [Gammaproteobacteria bacterium]